MLEVDPRRIAAGRMSSPDDAERNSRSTTLLICGERPTCERSRIRRLLCDAQLTRSAHRCTIPGHPRCRRLRQLAARTFSAALRLPAQLSSVPLLPTCSRRSTATPQRCQHVTSPYDSKLLAGTRSGAAKCHHVGISSTCLFFVFFKVVFLLMSFFVFF